MVGPNETLFIISLDYGTTVDQIKAANGLTTGYVYIGQPLLVCPSRAWSWAASRGRAVDAPARSLLQEAVVPGDTVVVVNANEVNVRRTPGYISKPYGDIITTVTRGQVLYVLSGPQYADGAHWWHVSQGYFTGWVAERSARGFQLLAPSPQVSPIVSPTLYTVVDDDTLTAISNRHQTKVASIMRLNGLTSTSLWIGQRLRIPPPELTPPVGRAR